MLLSPAALLAGSGLAIGGALSLWMRTRAGSVTGDPTGTRYRILVPPDHDGPAQSMLSDLARSGELAAPGPRLFRGTKPAAFGRVVRINACRISYSDYAAGPWSGNHPARLKHLYPGIRVEVSPRRNLA
ncbi:MAG: hypothetical protein F4X45_01880 [Chloroflexi bacterium]|nr:hypothetical protein [Chloroflexota bacterium]